MANKEVQGKGADMADTADKAYELGKKYERVYRGCSRCVVAALQDAFGIRNEDVFAEKREPVFKGT
jgi:hypothetical protein